MTKQKVKLLAIILGFILAGVLLFANKKDPCINDHTLKCWKASVENTFDKEGLVPALDLVEYYYKEAPGFAENCHNFGHLLGEMTYELFEKGEEFEVSPKTAFCSYGFYHGYMEVLVAKRGDATEAREFCHYVDERLGNKTPDASLQCFHGIGHGWVNAHDRPNTWGDDIAMSEPALELCRDVATNDIELSRCATGVFNGIAIFYSTGEYELTMSKTDPLLLCKRQTDPIFEDACYLSMNIALMQLTQGDFLRAARYIEEIRDPVMADHAILNLAIMLGSGDSLTTEDVVETCRQVKTELQTPCIQGFAFSFLEHGEPGREYVEALAVCEDGALSESEREGCFSYLFGYLAQWYSKEKALGICATYDKENQDFCTTQVENTLKGLGKF